MQREIKFRAWDPTQKRIQEWDYLRTWTPQDWVKAGIRPMQFTGLKDKNGKEIYEGDVIESIENGMQYLVHDIFPLSRFPQYDYSTPIAQKTKDFGTMTSNGIRENYSDDWVSNPEFYEVIGNIYENPELLK